ncbi:aromatic amino acid lyase, partial [candidate division KSB1 bacterium]|nr:aromatic amino acid lyase [candidate division KSB1 bacterium]
MKNVSIDGKHLSVNKLMRVAVKKAGLSLAKSVVQRIGRARAVVEKVIESGVVKYGINTGFGKLSELIITGDQMDQLQENLILSHASGVGSPLPEEIVRAIMVLKVHNLAAGYSGCRLEVVKTLVDMINAGVHPIIPEKGSVGASGDLAPLAHMALVMIG